jgi:hypothetical protein
LLPDQGVDPARAKPRRKTRAAETAAFSAWYELYPRKVKRTAAAAAWSALELDAKADEVTAALRVQIAFFKAQPIDKVPHPASWLNGGRWTDDPSAYRISPVVHRCDFHKRFPHVPSRFRDSKCVDCQHHSAARAGRSSEPSSAADALPSWAKEPPPAPWTPEQIAEAAAATKALKASQNVSGAATERTKTSNGGTP